MKALSPAILAGCVFIQTSFAQDITPEIVTDEVVVTATRFEEPQGMPSLGTQVITRSQIDASNARTIADVLESIGGIHTRDNTGGANRQLDLRGFGMTGDQNTLVLVNGRKISEIDLKPANLAAIPLSSVDRIEILRGSGAVLYGGGATGGTINIITGTPAASSRSVHLQAGAGNLHTYSAEARLNVASESLGLGLTARRYDTEGYRRNNGNRQDTIDGNVAFSGEKDRLTLGFGQDSQHTRFPGALSRALIAVDRRATIFPDDFGTLDTEYVSAAWLRTLEGLQFGVDASYRESEGHAFVNPGSSDYTNRSTLVSPRAKVSGDLAGMRNSLVVGMDWEDWDYDAVTVFPGFVPESNSTQSTLAAYVQDTLHVTDTTAISVGARGQRTRTEIQTRDNFTPTATAIQTVHPKAYEVGLRQALGPAVNAYLKAGSSFRVATVDENRGQTTPLRPQTSRDREAGIEYAEEGRRLRLSVYRMSVSDEIHFMFIPGGPFGLFGSNVNLPPTRHEGVEAEGQISLLRNLQALGRVEWQRARFREGLFAGVDVRGNDVPLVPRMLASLMLAWQPAPGWNLTGAVRHVGSQRLDNDQSNSFPAKMPAYTLVDLKAMRTLRQWTFTAEIDNVLGEEYFSYGIVNGTGTSYSAYPAPEQTFFLSAQYRFGP
jgi:iron complex outermembrane receptor protein